MGKGDKKKAYRKGLLSEILSAWYLRFSGYKILDRRFRTAFGEIDLIAQKGSCLVFIEVKHRHQIDAAAETISTKQKQRITNAARIFLQKNQGLANLDCRFDAILTAPGRWPRHIKDAWGM